MKNYILLTRTLRSFLVAAGLSTSLVAQSATPSVRILLPERTRLLQKQLVDIVLDFRFERQALHAYQITFVHPTTLQTMTLEAPLPQDIQRLLQVLRHGAKS
jgi:hypothetical protein